MPIHPADVQMPADMVEYLIHCAAVAERSAHNLAEVGDRDGHYRLLGQADAYRDAARIAGIVAEHIDAWYAHI